MRKAGTQTVLSRATTTPDTALNFGGGIGDTFLRGFETDPIETTVSGIRTSLFSYCPRPKLNAYLTDVHQMVPTDSSKDRASTLTANDREVKAFATIRVRRHD